MQKLRRVWQIKAASPEEAGAARAEFPVAGHRNMCHRKPRMSRCADCWPPKKKRRKDAKAVPQDAAFPDRPLKEKEGMNESMRRLYAQGPASATGATAKARSPDEKVEGASRRVREKAMAAARREQGLPEPRGSGFQPEERPEERLEDLGGVDVEGLLRE